VRGPSNLWSLGTHLSHDDHLVLLSRQNSDGACVDRLSTRNVRVYIFTNKPIDLRHSLSIQFCFLSTDQAEKGKGMSKIGWTMGMQRVRARQALNLS
jgi:hypothetical protein